MAADPSAPPLRADAERNRRRILLAAADAFAEAGIDAGVDDIARRAGVGIATLYRRFPTKDDLVLALLEERLEAFLEMCRAAARADDPWDGFAALVRDAVAMRARDRSFDEVFSAARFRTHPRMAELNDRIYEVLGALLERAREAGAVRADLSYGDLLLVLHGLGAIATQMRDVDPDYWQRPLAVVLDGLRAGAPLPGVGPSREDVRESFARQAARRAG